MCRPTKNIIRPIKNILYVSNNPLKHIMSRKYINLELVIILKKYLQEKIHD